MNWEILGDTKAPGCSLKNVHSWQRDIQSAPLCQQERLLAFPFSMLEIERESVAKKKTQLQWPISYIPNSKGNFCPLSLPLSTESLSLHHVPKTVGQHYPSCPIFPTAAEHKNYEMMPCPNKGDRCTEVIYHNCHPQGILSVTLPKSRQGRGCPAWMLHYGVAVLWWSRVTVVTTLLKFCFQHTSGTLGAKCFSLSP